MTLRIRRSIRSARQSVAQDIRFYRDAWVRDKLKFRAKKINLGKSLHVDVPFIKIKNHVSNEISVNNLILNSWYIYSNFLAKILLWSGKNMVSKNMIFVDVALANLITVKSSCRLTDNIIYVITLTNGLVSVEQTATQPCPASTIITNT